MTNKEVAQLVSDECYNARINKFIWIAFETGFDGDFREALNYISGKDLQRLFPLLPEKYFNSTNSEELQEEIIYRDYFGFLTEIYIPVMRRFKFKEGETMPWTWSGNDSHCRTYWVYAETIEELVAKIKEQAAIHFNVCVEEDSEEIKK